MVGPTLLSVSSGRGTPAQWDSSTKIIWSIGPRPWPPYSSGQPRPSQPSWPIRRMVSHVLRASPVGAGGGQAGEVGPQGGLQRQLLVGQGEVHVGAPMVRTIPTGPVWGTVPCHGRLPRPCRRPHLRPRPHPAGRALRRDRQDRGGHRGQPRDRSDDRRRVRGRRGPRGDRLAQGRRGGRRGGELSAYGSVSGLAADLSTEEGARSFAGAVAADHDRVHVLVNNAGATWGAPLAEHDTASWDRVLNLNVQGVFHTTKFFLPLLEAASHRRRPGPGDQHRLDRRHPRARARVLLVLGLQGRRPPADPAPGPSTGPRHHRQRRGPGPFESKMMAATLDAFGDQIAASAPLKRIGRPDDMAGVAIFLASRGRVVPDRGRHPGGRGNRHRRLSPPGRRPDGDPRERRLRNPWQMFTLSSSVITLGVTNGGHGPRPEVGSMRPHRRRRSEDGRAGRGRVWWRGRSSVPASPGPPRGPRPPPRGPALAGGQSVLAGHDHRVGGGLRGPRPSGPRAPSTSRW